MREYCPNCGAIQKTQFTHTTDKGTDAHKYYICSVCNKEYYNLIRIYPVYAYNEKRGRDK